jgi:hypothetical protein
LEHYIESVLFAGRKLSEFRAQHMGPDMLTAYHGVLRFPLIHHVGAFSSFIIGAIADRNARILTAYADLAGEPLFAANLCNSEFGPDDTRHDRGLASLVETKGNVLNQFLTSK